VEKLKEISVSVEAGKVFSVYKYVGEKNRVRREVHQQMLSEVKEHGLPHRQKSTEI
jgi:hypothetical protein